MSDMQRCNCGDWINRRDPDPCSKCGNAGQSDVYPSRNHLENTYRRTGRSTRVVFEILANCYKYPGSWIEILDHHGTQEANRHLAGKIQTIAYTLRFEFEYKMGGGRYFIRIAPDQFSTHP